MITHTSFVNMNHVLCSVHRWGQQEERLPAVLVAEAPYYE